jgi:hypothetical protein
MSEDAKILTEIKEQLVALNYKIEDVKIVLQNDRANLWKILGLTIAGAFALIGIKMFFS